MLDYILTCIDCGRQYKKENVEYVCPECTKGQKPLHPTLGVLRVDYDYDAVKKIFTREALKKKPARGHAKYIDLLPLENTSSLPPLNVGPTPLEKVERIRKKLGLKNLYIKNDTCLPTGSFKDRASSVIVAKARELGKNVITTASTGNAATALAGMCASVGMKSVIFVPETAPKAKLAQIAMFGAYLIPVKGTYDDAFELSKRASAEYHWYNRNTGYNPYTVEGKKTAALEIWEQLGCQAPDSVLIPTGDAVILAGIFKGFYDLIKLGLVEKVPRLIAVQAEGAAPIADAFERGDERVAPIKWPSTIADSICVAAPSCANWAIKILKETSSFTLKVKDEEIILAIRELATLSGIFAEPAAAAAYAGLIKVVKDGKITANEVVVVLITGTGLKDIEAAMKVVVIPNAIEPDIQKIPAPTYQNFQ